MSSNVFVSTSKPFNGAAAGAAGQVSAPVKAARRKISLPWRELPAVVPVFAVLVLIIGFCIVAEPLVVKDLPLLLR